MEAGYGLAEVAALEERRRRQEYIAGVKRQNAQLHSRHQSGLLDALTKEFKASKALKKREAKGEPFIFSKIPAEFVVCLRIKKFPCRIV